MPARIILAITCVQFFSMSLPLSGQGFDVSPAMDCPSNTVLESENLNGVIFCADHSELLPVHSHAERFTPDSAHIALLESYLILEDKIFDTIRCRYAGVMVPDIGKNLSSYHRQYFGLTGHDGKKIIWTYFIWSGELEAFPRWQCEFVNVLLSDTWYWSLYFDLDTHEFFGLETGCP